MFRPIPAIIRYLSESMVVVLYKIDVVIIKHYHHTDDGRNRPKHVVTIILH